MPPVGMMNSLDLHAYTPPHTRTEPMYKPQRSRCRYDTGEQRSAASRRGAGSPQEACWTFEASWVADGVRAVRPLGADGTWARFLEKTRSWATRSGRWANSTIDLARQYAAGA